jgi:hypothetical protein
VIGEINIPSNPKMKDERGFGSASFQEWKLGKGREVN